MNLLQLPAISSISFLPHLQQPNNSRPGSFTITQSPGDVHMPACTCTCVCERERETQRSISVPEHSHHVNTAAAATASASSDTSKRFPMPPHTSSTRRCRLMGRNVRSQRPSGPDGPDTHAHAHAAPPTTQFKNSEQEHVDYICDQLPKGHEIGHDECGTLETNYQSPLSHCLSLHAATAAALNQAWRMEAAPLPRRAQLPAAPGIHRNPVSASGGVDGKEPR